ncbi:MAG: tRNA (adenosine(37)-N6)-threonylcarbamoyltransferase complex dimerization subunit type 1 TsaB [Clostridia bacterium]|nr:tRNA (adenosine(37)-N6)-threonylcarbamoyltransferase complex dimerization subunit type 1 TsaB [Clostridia bacterium]
MKILAFDSTAVTASVAVAEDERLLAEITLNNGNTHSETLLPMAESLFRMLSITAEDIDLFATSSGPGSFTGVRIGAATLKGMAFGRGKPCVGISTLEALAYNLRTHKGIICPVMNARRSQVYTAIFESDGERVTRLSEDMAIAAEELDERLSPYTLPVYLVGDGIEVALECFKKTKAIAASENERYQSGYSVSQVALALYKEGKYTSDAEVTATYLRLSQAERERLEHENKQ